MDPRRLNQFARKHLLTVALIGVAGIFAICLGSSIGWALGGLYLLPVALISLWSSSRHYFGIMAVATIATVGLTITYFVSPHWANKLVSVTCYVLPVVTIWTIATLAAVRKWIQQSAQLSRTFSVCASCRKIKGEHGWSLDAYMQHPPSTLLRLDLCPVCTPQLGVDFQGTMAQHQPPLPTIPTRPRARRLRSRA